MRVKRRGLCAVTRFQGAIDVLDHRIDGSDTPGCIGPGPAVRAKAGTSLAFRLFLEILHRSVDNRDTRAFGHGMTGAEKPRRPGVVALEYGRRGQRDERVDKCELVMQVPNA